MEIFRKYLIYFLSPICPLWCSKFLFKKAFGKNLNLKNSQTLNEKIMWLKHNLYADNSLVTQCADKYSVREYVKKCGCEEILNTLYGVWNSVDDIDWENLPQAFVMKCNFACGYNILCPNNQNLDKYASIKKLKRWLRRDFWRFCTELQYRDIPKKIICEAFLDNNGVAPIDYKIYCFNGKPKYILLCLARENGNPKFYFYDSKWNFCPITKDGKNVSESFSIPAPATLPKMLQCAEKLSEPFPFVRVDLYDVEGKVIFGEMTFTPSAALDTARLRETDIMFGKMLKLPYENQ